MRRSDRNKVKQQLLRGKRTVQPSKISHNRQGATDSTWFQFSAGAWISGEGPVDRTVTERREGVAVNARYAWVS